MDKRRGGRGGDRREQILQVALGLFAQHGMANVTTRRIASAVGISQPSLYAHFVSAQAIADELAVRGFQALHARLAAVLAEQAPPREQLRRAGRAYIDFGLANPDVYRIVFMLEPQGQADCDGPGPALIEGLKAFGALHAVVVAVRGVDDARTAMAAQSCWAGVHGVVSLLLARPAFPWGEREALIDYHLECLVTSVT